jgi:hypothetical protein
MTRAVRVWAALGEERRGFIDAFLREMFNDDLADALDADLAEHDRLTAALNAPPWQPFLIPAHQAGPRRAAEHCDGCGEPVTRTRLSFYDFEQDRQLWLGEGCWRDRMLKRQRGADVAGDQLQAFPVPQPTREE